MAVFTAFNNFNQLFLPVNRALHPEFKLSYKFSDIIVALVGVAGGSIVTYLTAENGIELERLKMESSTRRVVVEQHIKRCDKIDTLYKNLTVGIQNVFIGNNSFEDSLIELGKLRSEASVAQTFFGIEANEVYEMSLNFVEAEKSKDEKYSIVEKKLMPAIFGLQKELEYCNKVNSLPINNA